MLISSPPLSKNKLISSLLSGNRNNQNYEIWSHLAQSAKNFEYLVLTVAETVINGKKTGENRPNRLKTGKILGVRFSCLALFLPSFSESLFLPHPWGGGRYWPKYLPLLVRFEVVEINQSDLTIRYLRSLNLHSKFGQS